MARESIKSLLIAGFIFISLAAVLAWFYDQPDTAIWACRWGTTFASATCLFALWKMSRQRDQAPDFLAKTTTNYFNCDGLCFVFRVVVADGVAYMTADFQNQFSNHARGRIWLRPSRSFFLNKVGISTMEFPVDCPTGGFGSSVLPLAIPLKLQGKNLNFDVSAEVEFPYGKGKRLRFGDGVFLRPGKQTSTFPGLALLLGGLFGGMIIFSSPNRLRTKLPKNVAETLPDDAYESLDIHWQYGDPVSTLELSPAGVHSPAPLTACV
jgi:hypothetical protein